MGPKFYACVPMLHDKKFQNCVHRRLSQVCHRVALEFTAMSPCRSCRFLPMYTPLKAFRLVAVQVKIVQRQSVNVTFDKPLH